MLVLLLQLCLGLMVNRFIFFHFFKNIRTGKSLVKLGMFEMLIESESGVFNSLLHKVHFGGFVGPHFMLMVVLLTPVFWVQSKFFVKVNIGAAGPY